MNLRLLTDMENTDELRNQTVLVRVDYNVPLVEKNGELVVKNDQRILSSRQTVDWLRARGNKVILLSHLGRPKDQFDPKFSLQPVVNYLNHVGWWGEVKFADDLMGEGALNAAQALAPGEVLLLENVRFYPGEKKNDPDFVAALARLGQVFVNEAFSSSHRAHASVFGLAEALPSFAGFALEAEVAALEKVIQNPARPLVVVVGGAKISDKVDAIVNLAKIADHVLVGGGIANNFLKAEQVPVFNSYVQDAPADVSKDKTNYVEVAGQIIAQNPGKIAMPVDVVAGESLEASKGQIVDLTQADFASQAGVSESMMYLDIGPQTIKRYKEIIAEAGTVFWNGPMGVFENQHFAAGTDQIAHAIAASSGIRVIGGGDTLSAAATFGVEKNMDYVSTAGSAGLEFLAGKPLPGLEVLRKDN